MLKTDPCPYLVKHSLDILRKKEKVLDFYNTYKKCCIKNNIESSLQEIWIRIRFLKINGSPSLVISHFEITIDVNTIIIGHVLIQTKISVWGGEEQNLF